MVSALDASLPSFSTSLAKASASKMFTSSVIVLDAPGSDVGVDQLLNLRLVLLEVDGLRVPCRTAARRFMKNFKSALYFSILLLVSPPETGRRKGDGKAAPVGRQPLVELRPDLFVR